MTTLDIIARLEGSVGRITLNRPAALHALTTAMCQAIIDALFAWWNAADVRLVLIDHFGERGFCAGGDIRMLAESGAGDGSEARRFFFTEYRMNTLLMAYPKPIVVIMDGIVMGGGVGIALPCDHRIATERTTIAMPETGIGLFPDVGGGWHLPRLPGESGLWLALTGARIKAADCLVLGIASDFVKSGQGEALKAAIVDDPEAVEQILARFRGVAGAPAVLARRGSIQHAFAAPTVEAILRALMNDGSEWAISQHDALMTKSPQTLKVAFRQLRAGREMTSFEANMAMEYRIGARVIQRHDFIEGVRAVIVDKDNAPKWRPEHLEAVTDRLLDEIFAPLPEGEEWSPLKEPT